MSIFCFFRSAILFQRGSIPNILASGIFISILSPLLSDHLIISGAVKNEKERKKCKFFNLIKYLRLWNFEKRSKKQRQNKIMNFAIYILYQIWYILYAYDVYEIVRSINVNHLIMKISSSFKIYILTPKEESQT